MTRPAPAPTRAAPSGFTLLELLVVLAIAGLLMAAVPPLLSQALPGLELKSGARQLAAGLRFARDRALATRQETWVEMDVEQREVAISGRDKRLRLSQDLTLSLISAETEMTDDNQGGIRFYPDGTSTGGRVVLSYAARGYQIDVDWLTGRVRVQAVEVPET